MKYMTFSGGSGPQILDDQGLEQWIPALLYALSGEFRFGGHSRFSLFKYFSTSR